jgi:hypothetical protein
VRRFSSREIRWPIFGILLTLTMAGIAGASTPVCSLHPPRFRVHRGDIFGEQQEQWLGDAQAEMVEPRYILLPESESTYLDEIGKRLLEELPPTSIHYTFRVFESPDLRAFSLAGGHVYISRKLIMDARNEDELAAMIAQEIGRVYIHHSASAVTLRLEKLMHVKTVGDREDVFDKFERVLNIPPNDFSQLTPSDQEHDELLADQVGIYAMIKAHYAPEAFAAFLDRVNNNGGYTGNLFTDLFDMTPEVSIRVRMAHKTVRQLPEDCRRPRPVYHPGFKEFRNLMRSQRINPIVPVKPEIPFVTLTPPMNPALENVVLSPDGKYVLAQDQYQIHILTTSPLQLRFSIQALGAEMAQFTPDSSGVVFNYNDLHVEKWDLVSGQPVSLQDYVDYAGCLQTSLSPDGSTMACVSYNYDGDAVWLKLVDLGTDRMLYQNMHFCDTLGCSMNSNVRYNPNFQALMRWTRDGRYFVAASGTSAMAYDLKLRQEVKLEKSLSGLSQQRFSFVSSDKMVSTCDWSFKPGTPEDTFRMCYTSFPGGKSLGSFDLPRGWLTGAASGDYLLFGPVANAAAVLLYPATGKAGPGFPMEAVDLNGDELAMETQTGGIAFGTVEGKMQVADLPVTPLADLESWAFSGNGRYLAISDRGRGAEWDLTSGRRIALTMPFRAVDIDDQGNLQVQFVHHELVPSIDLNIDKRIHKYTPALTAIADPVQFGSVRTRIKPRGVAQNLNEDVDLEGYDASSEAHLWTMHFDFTLPQLVPTENEKLLIITDRESRAGLSELSRCRGRVVKTSDRTRQLLDPQGTLIEIVSNRTGKVEQAVLAPQMPSTRREERTAALFGKLLAVYGNNNDTSVYRTSDGKRMLGFFGRALAGDEMLGMVAATNRVQELTIYGVATGKELASLKLDHAVLAAHFVPETKELLVLTATQRIYRINLAPLMKQQ